MDEWTRSRNEAIRSGKYQTATREGLEKRNLAMRGLADHAREYQKQTIADIRAAEKMHRLNLQAKLARIEEMEDEGWWQSFERRIDKKLSPAKRESIRKYWKSKK